VGFVVDKAALGQVFSEYFGFPCQSYHQFLHHHNQPGLAQYAYWWQQWRVDPIGLHPPLYQFKKKLISLLLLLLTDNYTIFNVFTIANKEMQLLKLNILALSLFTNTIF
jgi:hypothetical protein